MIEKMASNPHPLATAPILGQPPRLSADPQGMLARATRIRVVLNRPSHPGNIGATARAMWTMGLQHLYLVAPDLFPSEVAMARAAGADSVLEQAVVCADLDTALQGVTLVLATSARQRSVAWPLMAPRVAMQTAWQAAEQGQVAILFGREDSGLSNADLDRAQIHVAIPVNPAFHSLNLASAVQILSYELYLAMTGQAVQAVSECSDSRDQAASAINTERFFAHLESVLRAIGFIKVPNSSRLFRKIRRLFVRSGMSVDEVNIFRGILSAIEYQLQRKNQ